jgi:phosphinothricin acetyltransferase
MSIDLRLAHPGDAAGILAIYAPHCESTCVSFEVVAPSVVQMRERMDGVIDQYPWLMTEIDEEVAGYVYASRHRERAAYRWGVDVAVYIATQHHGQGLGRALYTSLFAILRAQGYFKAYAGISLPNAASVGLHEAMGFRMVGKFPGNGFKLGRWVEVGWWQLDLQPEVMNPTEPLPFSSIRDGEAVAAALGAGQRLLQAASH